MKALKMMVPAPIVSVTNVAGTGNALALLTPDPKEAATFAAGGGAATFDVDLGSPQIIDTLFFGYNTIGVETFVQSITIGNNANGSSNPVAYSGLSADGSLSVTPVPLMPRRRHGVVQLAAPVIGRYVRVQIGANFATAASLGVFACGSSFTARWGTEYGAGRPLTDTSVVERLFGGGYGIDVGAVVSGYQWTFGDLSNAEREALFRRIERLGTGRSLLVIEDPDFSYGTLLVKANAAITGGGRIATKNSGADATLNSSVYTIPDASTRGISFQIRQAPVDVSVGLSTIPSLATDLLGYSYALELANGNQVYRRIGGSATLIGNFAMNDRFSIAYDEASFVATQNGAVIDAVTAPPDLLLGLKATLYNTNDQIADVAVVSAGYDARVHWGLLSKLDSFERTDPTNTKWSLAIADWG